MVKKAVFLDRDGVILKPIIYKKKSYAIRSLSDFKFLPGVIKSIRKLKKKGFLVFVVSNQPDIGHGIITKSFLNKVNKKIKLKTNIDAFATCPHRQNEKCSCRKPKPGMILSLAKRYKVYLKKSYMVGDRASDINAGKKAKCKTIFIDNKHEEKKHHIQEATFKSLLFAVDHIISKSN